jgi:hypothetical protein
MHITVRVSPPAVANGRYGVDPGEECPAVDVYLERLGIRQAWKSSDVDRPMHLLYTLSKLGTREPVADRLSSEAMAAMRAATYEERKGGGAAKQNFCL